MQAIKYHKAASLSLTSMSAGTHDITDDVACNTRASLTQESCPNDSCCHTWASSLSPSLRVTPSLAMLPRAWVHVTPPDSPLHEQRKASVKLCEPHWPRPERREFPAGVRGDGVGGDGDTDAASDSALDVFDVALALDVEQRRRRNDHRSHHHPHQDRHHHRRRRQRVSKPVDGAADHDLSLSSPAVGCNVTSKKVVRATAAGDDAVVVAAAAAAAATHPAASRAPTSPAGVHFLIKQDADSPLQPRSLVASTAQGRRAQQRKHSPAEAATVPAVAGLVSEAVPTDAQLHRAAVLQHLKRLLRETRSLHTTLCQQVLDLQRQEAQDTLMHGELRL